MSYWKFANKELRSSEVKNGKNERSEVKDSKSERSGTKTNKLTFVRIYLKIGKIRQNR